MPTRSLLLLIGGVAACSSAALFIKASALDPALIAAWRLLVGGTLLLPLFIIARRRHPECSLRRVLDLAWPAALLLALHFWSWNAGVHRTHIANATLIVNMTAPVMPLIVWVLLREPARRRELLGTAVALAGSVVLAGSDLRFAPDRFLGDVICFTSMLTFACYLVWSRRTRALPSLWLYAPPVYLLAGILCLAIGWARTGDPLPPRAVDWWPLLGLALVPTILGHSTLNHAMRHLPSQVVAVVNLGQFIPATILAWLIFHERPAWQFPVAVILVVGGAVITIRTRRDAE